MAVRKHNPDKGIPAQARVRISPDELKKNEQAGFQQVWSVHENYKIVQATEANQQIRVLIQSPGARLKRHYAPAVHPQLVQDFARVRDEPTLLNFAHHFGQLGHWAHVAPEERCGGDPVPWAIAHARRVSAITDILEIISDALTGKIGDSRSPLVLEKLRQPIETVLRSAGIKPARMGVLEWGGRPIPGLTQIFVDGLLMTVHWPENPIRTAYQAIATMVNPVIGGMHYKLEVRPNDSKLVLQFQSLLQIIYWRLASQLRGEWRRCKRPDCGQIFLVTDPRREHCSIRCRNLHKQREFRKRQQSRSK